MAGKAVIAGMLESLEWLEFHMLWTLPNRETHRWVSVKNWMPRSSSMDEARQKFFLQRISTYADSEPAIR